MRCLSALGVTLAMLVACDYPLVAEEKRPTFYGELWKAISKAAEDPRDVVLTKEGWVRGRSPDELAVLLSGSGREERPVVVYAYAAWYAYGKSFESAVLLDSGVKAELEGYTLVLVDVTDPSPGENALRDLLGFGFVFVYESGGAVAESLRVGRKPELRATMKIDTDDQAELRSRFVALLE